MSKLHSPNSTLSTNTNCRIQKFTFHISPISISSMKITSEQLKGHYLLQHAQATVQGILILPVEIGYFTVLHYWPMNKWGPGMEPWDQAGPAYARYAQLCNIQYKSLRLLRVVFLFIHKWYCYCEIWQGAPLVTLCLNAAVFKSCRDLLASCRYVSRGCNNNPLFYFRGWKMD